MAKGCLLAALSLILTCCCCGLLANDAGKYARQNNEANKFGNENPFRMMKLNLVWAKAQKRLSSAELMEFHKELLVQDKLEIDLKRRKAEGYDKDGEYEASTRKHFAALLNKYNLYELHPEAATADPRMMQEDILENKKLDKIKMDKKLGKLWKKAQMVGFTADQLDALQAEFEHHQEKVDEFETLKDELNNKLYDPSDNSVEGLKKDKMKMAKEERLALKNKYGHLKESFKALEESLGEPIINEDTNLPKFKHPKVVDLWVEATRANFTEEELRSFSVELQHFEHKLEKLEFFSNEALDGTANMKKMGASLDEYPEKRLKLEEKMTDYGRKVKKIETELRDRLNRKHAEL